MTEQQFEQLLEAVCADLRSESRTNPFRASKPFENRVREVVRNKVTDPEIYIDPNPPAQGFPDIAVGNFGIEVKFSEGDTWRCVANSVLETNRVEGVEVIYVIFGKMGGGPDVKWDKYEECVMHVRTSHVPRFEIEIGAEQSLFELMGISYDEFRHSEMHEKMQYIRRYARGRLSPGERLWWLEDEPGEQHSVPIQARLYTSLTTLEKIRLRAEAYLICPRAVAPRNTKKKYDDAVLYLLTYHGVLCHQARDLFSAGSVGNPNNDDDGGPYIARAIMLIEAEMIEASLRMDDSLFVEYWGVSVPPEERIGEWLRRADEFARDWKPSELLFLDHR